MNDDSSGDSQSFPEAPTEYIPRVVVSPDDAQTELIPKIVYTPPPPPSGEADGGFGGGGGRGGDGGFGGDGGEPEQGPRSARATARIARQAQHKLVVLSSIGEVLITLGAVLALYVVYTLWWTNVEAHKAANAEANQIQQQFQHQLTPSTPGGGPKSAFAPSEGFALMTIPAIGKSDIPVMQGTDKAKVLDKGAVGHYTTPDTAMPWDPTGNFAVAAHRRTYGEPFRYINELRIGDHVVVETTHGWYVYALDKELPQTDPTNIGTIAPIPKGGPFTKPGKYITLTTCTPEWASTYRLIWWGHLERVDPLNGPPPAELKDANRHS
jgi:sortase A